jgi:hypothetical protein
MRERLLATAGVSMTRLWIATILAASSVLPAMAHEVTYKGTVVSIELNRYAASDGVLARLEVKVGDRAPTMTFDITQYTRFWRGNGTVPFAAVRIQKNEAVAVTFSDEEADKGALEIRLPAAE